jgi:hypothetical protein
MKISRFLYTPRNSGSNATMYRKKTMSSPPVLKREFNKTRLKWPWCVKSLEDFAGVKFIYWLILQHFVSEDTESN